MKNKRPGTDKHASKPAFVHNAVYEKVWKDYDCTLYCTAYFFKKLLAHSAVGYWPSLIFDVAH